MQCNLCSLPRACAWFSQYADSQADALKVLILRACAFCVTVAQTNFTYLTPLVLVHPPSPLLRLEDGIGAVGPDFPTCYCTEIWPSFPQLPLSDTCRRRCSVIGASVKRGVCCARSWVSQFATFSLHLPMSVMDSALVHDRIRSAEESSYLSQIQEK